jgi:hypothetical protein
MWFVLYKIILILLQHYPSFVLLAPRKLLNCFIQLPIIPIAWLKVHTARACWHGIWLLKVISGKLLCCTCLTFSSTWKSTNCSCGFEGGWCLRFLGQGSSYHIKGAQQILCDWCYMLNTNKQKSKNRFD